MSEEIKVWKTNVINTGNDWGYGSAAPGSTITVDLSQITEKIKFSSTNNVKFLLRPTRKEERKPENRAFNYKLLTEKIDISGKIVGPDAVDTKNKLVAIQQAGGLCNLKVRDEEFAGGTPKAPYISPKYVVLTSANFDDDYTDHIAISGTTSVTSSTIHDTSKNFFYPPNDARPGDIVKNKTTGTQGTVTMVLNPNDVMTSTTFTNGDAYEILKAKSNEVVYKFNLSFTKAVPRS